MRANRPHIPPRIRLAKGTHRPRCDCQGGKARCIKGILLFPLKRSNLIPSPLRSPNRRRLWHLLRHLMTALLIAAGVAASPATAQTPANAAPAPDAPVELAADQVTYDPRSGEVVATGNVLIERDGYRLEAGEVRYNETSGVVEADGGLRITDPGGNVITATRARLNDSLRDGFVENIRLVLTDGSRVAAVAGSRTSDERNVLSRAVYSPCKVCDDEPGDTPVWRIKAVKITHDQGKKRLYYRHAFLEVLGVPVAYLPYFSHPDPSVDRASGLLPIRIRQRRELGVVLDVPYHIVLSPSRDLTVTPILATEENPVLAADFRQHLGFGKFNFGGSVTYTDAFDFAGEDTGREEFRGHISSDGTFRHGRRWRSTYQARWASDDTYLRRYGFSDEDALRTEYLLEGFYGRSYISARTLAFQGLRVEDVTGLTPHALPLLDAEYVSRPGLLGGVVSVRGNALALFRTGGQDTRRLTVAADWHAPFAAANGMLFDASAYLRGDLYDVSDADSPDDPLFAGENGTTVRGLPRASLTWRWPFARVGRRSQQVIEPIVAVVVAPEGGNPSAIPNEDSRAFELADSNLFDDDRIGGFDLWEGGTRVTYGLRWQLFAQKLKTELLFGQSYRVEAEPDLFFAGTGLDDNFSDFIGQVAIQYADWVDIEQRLRLDRSLLEIRRNEVEAVIGPERLRVTAGYLRLDRDLAVTDRQDREEVRVGARIRLTRHWTLFGNVIEDLTIGADPIEYGVGLLYSDECLEFSLQLRETFTEDRDVEPGTSLLFRLKLRNLG